MSKEKIRKVIEGMEKSGKMKNVVLAKQEKTAQPESQIYEIIDEYIQFLRKWQGKLTAVANSARTVDIEGLESAINYLIVGGEALINEGRDVLRKIK